MKQTIAIVFTCFNRKDQSLHCIESLMSQNAEFDIYFYICDDASTDGTYESIKKAYPAINIERSNGNLYWCKGMHYAMNMATQQHHDFYLMINDDVDFNENAIEIMLTTYKRAGKSCGVVGSTVSNVTGEITYGGRVSIPFKMGGKEFGVKSTALINNIGTENLQKCHFTNWNCFLIDSQVIKKVGLISNSYAHSLGDYDYSFRMRKAGFDIFIAPERIGYCERNEKKDTYYDANCPKKRG